MELRKTAEANRKEALTQKVRGFDRTVSLTNMCSSAAPAFSPLYLLRSDECMLYFARRKPS